MRTTILTAVTLCLLSGLSQGGIVAYHSDEGTATGFSYTRNSGQFYFVNAPASLSLSYVYDASIPGITQNGETTFTVPTLGIIVIVPGYFSGYVNPGSTSVPGTVVWSGDTIEFDAKLAIYGQQPSLTIDVAFTGSALTPGLLPSSLSGLEATWGSFSVDAEDSILYHGDGGSITGGVISSPEPSSCIILAVGILGIYWRMQKRGKS